MLFHIKYNDDWQTHFSVCSLYFFTAFHIDLRCLIQKSHYVADFVTKAWVKAAVKCGSMLNPCAVQKLTSMKAADTGDVHISESRQ